MLRLGLSEPSLWPFLAPKMLRLHPLYPPTRSRSMRGISSCIQSRGVPAHVIFHESRYEVIAVVIAGLAAKNKGNARLRTGALQQFGTKLLGQELIGIANIDKEIGEPRAILDKCDGIVLAPGVARVAEISAQCLNPPWRL